MPHSNRQAAHVGTTINKHESTSAATVTKRVSPAPRRAKDSTKFMLSNMQYTATKRNRTSTIWATAAHFAGVLALAKIAKSDCGKNTYTSAMADMKIHAS